MYTLLYTVKYCTLCEIDTTVPYYMYTIYCILYAVLYIFPICSIYIYNLVFFQYLL